MLNHLIFEKRDSRQLNSPSNVLNRQSSIQRKILEILRRIVPLRNRLIRVCYTLRSAKVFINLDCNNVRHIVTTSMKFRNVLSIERVYMYNSYLNIFLRVSVTYFSEKVE